MVEPIHLKKVSQIGKFPSKGEHEKYLKPPPSNTYLRVLSCLVCKFQPKTIHQLITDPCSNVVIPKAYHETIQQTIKHPMRCVCVCVLFFFWGGGGGGIRNNHSRSTSTHLPNPVLMSVQSYSHQSPMLKKLPELDHPQLSYEKRKSGLTFHSYWLFNRHS